MPGMVSQGTLCLFISAFYCAECAGVMATTKLFIWSNYTTLNLHFRFVQPSQSYTTFCHLKSKAYFFLSGASRAVACSLPTLSFSSFIFHSATQCYEELRDIVPALHLQESETNLCYLFHVLFCSPGHFPLLPNTGGIALQKCHTLCDSQSLIR